MVRVDGLFEVTHSIRALLQRCAFVGSGHDLRCRPRGAEIDAHAAVFRANAGQQQLQLAGITPPAERERVDSTISSISRPLRKAGARGASRAAARRLHGRGGGTGGNISTVNIPEQAREPTWQSNLRTHTVNPAVAGRRTTYRVNCLYQSHVPDATRDGLEACIVSRAWFRQPWGAERFNNARHACCERGVESSYTMAELQRHARSSGVAFAFFAGVADSGIRTLDAMLAGSGGNALHAALSLCRRVNVFGAGLYTTALGASKVYTHLYDWGAGRCMEPSIYPAVAAKARQCDERARSSAGERRTRAPGAFCASRESWARARVRTELLLHLLHALEIVRWMQ
eukprot:7146218-Prymnesium_polylepis.1